MWQNSKWDKIKKEIKIGHNFKTQNVTKLKCGKTQNVTTQKFKMRQNSKTKKVTGVKNSKSEEEKNQKTLNITKL